MTNDNAETEYHLNLEQALALALLADTDAAQEVRRDLIHHYLYGTAPSPDSVLRKIVAMYQGADR